MLNSFNKRINKINFSISPNNVAAEVAKNIFKGPLSKKQEYWFSVFLFTGNEWNMSMKYRESPEGQDWIKKITQAWKDLGKDIFYDYILTDEYFLFILDNKKYNQLMDKIYEGTGYAESYHMDPKYNYFVSGEWQDQDSDLQGNGKDVNKAVEDYNKNCNLYLKEGYLQVVHRWEGKSAKGKVKAVPPQVTPEQVISGKYNFSKVDIEKYLDAMSDATLNNEADAIKILKEKFKLSDEDAAKYYHGYCGDKEFSMNKNFSDRVKKLFSAVTDPVKSVSEVLTDNNQVERLRQEILDEKLITNRELVDKLKNAKTFNDYLSVIKNVDDYKDDPAYNYYLIATSEDYDENGDPDPIGMSIYELLSGSAKSSINVRDVKGPSFVSQGSADGWAVVDGVKFYCKSDFGLGQIYCDPADKDKVINLVKKYKKDIVDHAKTLSEFNFSNKAKKYFASISYSSTSDLIDAIVEYGGSGYSACSMLEEFLRKFFKHLLSKTKDDSVIDTAKTICGDASELSFNNRRI